MRCTYLGLHCLFFLSEGPKAKLSALKIMMYQAWSFAPCTISTSIDYWWLGEEHQFRKEFYCWDVGYMMIDAPYKREPMQCNESWSQDVFVPMIWIQWPALCQTAGNIQATLYVLLPTTVLAVIPGVNDRVFCTSKPQAIMIWFGGFVIDEAYGRILPLTKFLLTTLKRLVHRAWHWQLASCSKTSVAYECIYILQGGRGWQVMFEHVSY